MNTATEAALKELKSNPFIDIEAMLKATAKDPFLAVMMAHAANMVMKDMKLQDERITQDMSPIEQLLHKEIQWLKNNRG